MIRSAGAQHEAANGGAEATGSQYRRDRVTSCQVGHSCSLQAVLHARSSLGVAVVRRLFRLESSTGAEQQADSLQKDLDEARTALSESQEEITDLKEMLETAAMYETMVEELTEKNLSLGEQVEELTATVTELEDIREMSEEVCSP